MSGALRGFLVCCAILCVVFAAMLATAYAASGAGLHPALAVIGASLVSLAAAALAARGPA